MTSPDDVRSRTMRAVKSKDTQPEWLVRRLLHAAGFRYRLHAKDLPGKPDLVFPSRRKVVFVHGCFWHGHDCPRGDRQPKTNTDYWQAKIGRNKARDVEHLAALRARNWQVLTVWECEIKERGLLARLAKFLGGRTTGP
jgi:DNA mismatch endonuclease (patch repair protein)